MQNFNASVFRIQIVSLAIFDLDHTLLAGDSDHSWGEFLVEQEVVDPSFYKRQNDYFYEQYKAGTLDIHEYLAFTLKPLTEHSLETVNKLREQFLEEKIKPIITQKSVDLLNEHRNKGDQLLIITATNAFVTRPIAEMLGVDELIAPEPEMLNGAYTGKITGIPSFKDGKVTRLDMWLKEHNQSLEGAYFYSDSHNDLPLLEYVDNPVAANPDEKLTAVAEQNNWPIISLLD